MATQLSGELEVVGSPLFSSGGDSTIQHQLGARAVSTDGRAFRYVLASGTALVAGKLQQGPAQITNHQNLTPSAAAIGDTSITVTLGASPASANFYAAGYAVITVTPGVGYTYKIKSHPAAAASAALVVTLEDAIEVALTGTSRVDLVTNPYSNVIVNSGTIAPIGPVVGVATDVISANNYGWIQTHGVVGCLAEGTLVVGNNVFASDVTDGAVAPAGTSKAVVGYAVTGVATTEYGAIYLTLD